MKWDTPAFASVSSREPAPIQKPIATDRTLGTRSEITRSPVSSSEKTYFWTCTPALSRRRGTAALVDHFEDDDPAEAPAIHLHAVAAGLEDADARRDSAAAGRPARPRNRVVRVDSELRLGNLAAVEPHRVATVELPTPDQDGAAVARA